MRNSLSPAVANRLRVRYTGNPQDVRFLAEFSPYDLRAAGLGDRGVTRVAVFMLSRGVKPFWLAVEARHFAFGDPLEFPDVGDVDATLEANGMQRITDVLNLPRDNAEAAGIVASLERDGAPWRLVKSGARHYLCRPIHHCRPVPDENDPAGDVLADSLPFSGSPA